MRDDQTIEREIDAAREDLEVQLHQLRDVITDKIHVGKHIREAIHNGLGARPLITMVVALGLGALAGLIGHRQKA
jgi:hypothetical protein